MRVPPTSRLIFLPSATAVLFAAACSSDGGGGAKFDPPCDDGALPSPAFATSIALSGTSGSAFLPSIASRDEAALVAWHEFDATGSHIAYARLVDGCASAARRLDTEPLPNQLRPSLAATDSGWALAYQARLDSSDAIRLVRLDPAGDPLAAPETISAPGAPSAQVRIAAAGDDLALAWTDGTAHFFALRGSETTAAAPVGTTLISGGILNYPRIALGADGTLFLAWRDGGTSGVDWDTLLTVRPAGGAFGPTENVSGTPGLLSDDIAVALEENGTLDLVWVDQNPDAVTDFDVMWARRAPDGTIGLPSFFGEQGTMAWLPSVVSGLAAVWHTGPSGASGELSFADGPGPAIPILEGEEGGMVSLARAPGGALHLAYTTGGMPRRIRYAWMR